MPTLETVHRILPNSTLTNAKEAMDLGSTRAEISRLRYQVHFEVFDIVSESLQAERVEPTQNKGASKVKSSLGYAMPNFNVHLDSLGITTSIFRPSNNSSINIQAFQIVTQLIK